MLVVESDRPECIARGAFTGLQAFRLQVPEGTIGTALLWAFATRRLT